jgi:hypothetical protein
VNPERDGPQMTLTPAQMKSDEISSSDPLHLR